MISHISYSSLSMALRCGEQFRRRYVLGQIIPPAVAMGMGRGLHKASELNLGQKVITGQDIPKDEMVDIARDEFVNTFRDGVFLAPDEAGQKDKLLNEALNKTVAVTELHHDQAAPKIHPKETELKFNIKVPGADIPLMGFIDCVEEGDLITDLKSTSRSWPKDKVAKDLQPVFYTIAHKHLYPESSPRFRFLVHVAIKTPKLQELDHTVQPQQETALYARIQAVMGMLKQGVFLPTDPGAWACSPRWCGYYQSCKYVGNGKPSTWV